MKRSLGNYRQALTAALVLTLAIGVCANVAMAGDTDGVAGYSMRLKQKDFDGGEWSGGLYTAHAPATRSVGEPTIQQAHPSAASLDIPIVVKWWFIWIATYKATF